jgi:hypothetical protein
VTSTGKTTGIENQERLLAMKWSYKTVHFELKKEGLLGGSFLDEAEIEEQLNDFGRSGWELTSIIEVQDGVIAFFKQPLDVRLSYSVATSIEEDRDSREEVEEYYETAEAADGAEAGYGDEADDEYLGEEERQAEFYGNECDAGYPEEHEIGGGEDGADYTVASEDDYAEFVDDDQQENEARDRYDDQEESADQRGIGAIRIE